MRTVLLGLLAVVEVRRPSVRDAVKVVVVLVHPSVASVVASNPSLVPDSMLPAAHITAIASQVDVEVLSHHMRLSCIDQSAKQKKQDQQRLSHIGRHGVAHLKVGCSSYCAEIVIYCSVWPGWCVLGRANQLSVKVAE